jgi:D-proline reductase (dithiol) PrdB
MMPRLERLSEVNRQTLTAFPCLERETAPWQPMQQDLAQSRLALVTSAGLHLRGDRPFISNPKGGDTSYRVIPATAKAAEITQSHASIGFDRTAIYQDINVTLPIDRVQELAARGVIGSVAPNFYSFMGALRNPRGMVEETGPEVAQRLKQEGVDVVFLTPT